MVLPDQEMVNPSKSVRSKGKKTHSIRDMARKHTM